MILRLSITVIVFGVLAYIGYRWLQKKNAEKTAKLEADVDALRNQVLKLGQKPVINKVKVEAGGLSGIISSGPQYVQN